MSTTAAACPNCGAKPIKSVGIKGALLALIVGVAIYQCNSPRSSVASPPVPSPKYRAPTVADPVPAPTEMSRSAATGACMQLISKSLHDPSSAEFSHSQNALVKINGSHALVIRDVRAKNGFGAIRTTEYGCILETRGDMIYPIAFFENGKQTKQDRAKIKKFGL